MNLNGTWQQPAFEQIPEADVPHPSTYAKVDIVEMTEWMYTDDAVKVPKSAEFSTKCCIAEEVISDDYGMERSRKPFVRHRYYDEKAKKWSPDIASSMLKADYYLTSRTQNAVKPGLKDRFGKAIAAYEARLVRDEIELPVVLLADRVYPQVINALELQEIDTIQQFAGASKAVMAKVENYLKTHGQIRMAAQLKGFQDRAKEKLAELGAVTKEAA